MQRYVLEYAGAAHEAEVEEKGDGLYSVTVDGRTLEVDARLVEQTVLSLIVEGACREVRFSKERGAYTLLIGGETLLDRRAGGHGRAEARRRGVGLGRTPV